MVYTVTFNPSIDYFVSIKELKLGVVNRTCYEEMFIGGKGINVSIILNELGIKSKALGFTAGSTGEVIENSLKDRGIDTDFIKLKNGNSRINVKIRSLQETEINGQGPQIDEEALTALFDKLDALTDGDTLILAGSVPNSLPSDIYEIILHRLSGIKIKTVVDAANDLLLKVLKYEPFLIKPNDHELGEMFGVNLTTIEEIEKYAKKLQDMGAKNVLVSMAGDGALLIDENGEVHICGVCSGTVKNSVGAGDSMVAGFIAGLSEGDYEYALRLGTAAGGATAFSVGLAAKERIAELMKTL
ncbi:MAG: 1-phosphofructokinase [Clostridia bacterium]|nr:1-phosphofructokinase [Clostridia bacterium]